MSKVEPCNEELCRQTVDDTTLKVGIRVENNEAGSQQCFDCGLSIEVQQVFNSASR